MLQRGRILRDTTSGVGLISANGNQYEFKLEGMWRSDISPQQNMVVDFELDDAGKITSLSAVNETDLAKEQAEKAMLAVKEKGLSAINGISSSVSKPVLIASATLLVSWFFLNTIWLQIDRNNQIVISFWNLLGLANSSGGLDTLMSLASGDNNKGIYGLLAIASLAGPFIYHFWKTSIAHIGNCMPLITMLLAAFSLASSALNASSSQFGNQVAMEVLKATHLGAGFYLGLISSIFLAFVGLKKYLAAKT